MNSQFVDFRSARIRSLASLIALGVLLGISEKGLAQQTFLPFDSTWYGYNTQIAVGTQSYFISSAKLADVDNDGDSDVVGSKFGPDLGTSRGFFVLKNRGNGVFDTPPVHYSSPLASRRLEVADLNNDGWKDVIVSNTGTNDQGSSILVYMNQGDGTFGSPTAYTVGVGPVGIAAADFNGDGNVDLAVTNYHGGIGTSLSILMNSGGGVFSAAVNYPAGDAPYAIAAARVNADSLVDLVVAGGWVNGGATINVLLNAGNGTFSNRTEYVAVGRAQVPSLAVADVDNDGDNDILFPSYDFVNGVCSITLYRNQGGGTFSSVSIPMDPNTILADIETADINGDGWKDIVASSASARTTDGYSVALNNGSGNFSFSYRNPAGQNTAVVMLGDTDNDGRVDILTADSYSMQITVHKNFGQGLFPLPHMIDLAGSQIVGSIDAADIDGDGLRDVVISASGRGGADVPVKVLKNLGHGAFGPPITYSIRGGGVQAKFRDINGDSIPDLLFATAIGSAPYDFHYAINLGDGTFGPVQTKSIVSPSPACGWYDIDAFDLNNDGKKDVVLTEPYGCQGIIESSRRIFICLNNGDGTFADPIIKLVGPHPSPLVGGDFNRDGKIDLAAGVAGAMIEIYFGIGNGDVMPPVQVPIGIDGGAEDLVVADFNNDGKLDLTSDNLLINPAGAYTMSVLYGNGDGTFQPAVILPSPQTPDLLNVSGITVGDVDGDGDKDIMVANYATNTISFYLNDITTFRYVPVRLGTYYGVYSPFFADFDNDGKGDLVAVASLPDAFGGLFSTMLFMRGKNMGPTSVAHHESSKPYAFALEQNYPNPFNPTTNIGFQLPSSGFVSLKVYDVLGREVATLVNETLEVGRHQRTLNASGLASGVYYYRLRTGNTLHTRAMIVLR